MDKISKVPSRRGGGKTLLISKKKKSVKIKKTDKKGKPLEGVEFKMYANKEDALNDRNVLDTQKTNENGIATFESDIYYDSYIKETKILGNYILRNGEKDIVHFYKDNGVRFLGEIEPKNMRVSSINQEGKEKSPDLNKNVNQELQSLVSYGISFNDNTNWLVFNDNGKEKLVAKRPLKYETSWNSLYNAGLVFDENGVKDLINADFTNFNYYSSFPEQTLKDYGKYKWESKTYNPTYLIINNKKYIVKLMRMYNEKVDINNHPIWDRNSANHYNAIKGSEWNRLILPLIDPTKGRDSSSTIGFVESNMPTLANYSWEMDFKNNNGSNFWGQETSYMGEIHRATHSFSWNNTDGMYPSNSNSYFGWLPVLELVN